MAAQGKFLFFDPSRGSFFWLIWTKNVIFDIFPTGIRVNRRLNAIGRDPFQQFSIFDLHIHISFIPYYINNAYTL